MASKYQIPQPELVVVFGGAGRMGPGLIDHVKAAAPEVRIRIVTSKEANRAGLAERFPQAEVVIGSYFDRPSLERAFAGADAAFVVTPSFLDEVAAMTNLIAAAEAEPRLWQIIRIIGDPPGMRLDRIPQVLKDFGGGTAIQHLIARDMLEKSGLPVTFLNITNTFVDNFRGMAPMLREGYWVAPTDRRIGYVDPADVGEAIARILLSGDSRHIRQYYNVDNGELPRRNHEVTAMMSAMFGYPVELILSEDRFAAAFGPVLNRRYGHDRGAEYMIEYMRFEEANEFAFRASDFLATTLGRQPGTLEAWLRENIDLFRKG